MCEREGHARTPESSPREQIFVEDSRKGRWGTGAVYISPPYRRSRHRAAVGTADGAERGHAFVFSGFLILSNRAWVLSGPSGPLELRVSNRCSKVR